MGVAVVAGSLDGVAVGGVVVAGALVVGVVVGRHGPRVKGL